MPGPGSAGPLQQRVQLDQDRLEIDGRRFVGAAPQYRGQRLVEVVQRRAHERASRFIGRTVEVLVEGPSRTDPSRLRGRSRHNKVVNFSGLGAAGELVDFEILEATSQTLSGQESILSRAALSARR